VKRAARRNKYECPWLGDHFHRTARIVQPEAFQFDMKPRQRILQIIFGLLLAGTAGGLVVTSDWGSRTVSLGGRQPAGPQSPVDMHQMQTAMALAPLAVSVEEQESARDALRMADHEVDFEFAAALREATSQPVPSTPEIRAILERISKAKKSVAEIEADVARITKLQAAATGNQKQSLAQQLDLAKARLELNEDELADAGQDLERAGGDPQSRIQRMVNDHNAAQQDSNGQLDLSAVGKQAATTLPGSSSFFPRARAWYTLHSFLGRLGQAGQEANTKAATLSSRHDDLEGQLEQAQAQQSSKLANSASGRATGGNLGASSSTSEQTDAAISSYRSLTALQKRMSGLDSRIRNQQDLAGVYGHWIALAASRERALLHSLFLSFGWILLIALAVLILDRFLARIFNRLEPDQKKLLTLRAVAHLAAHLAGAILILLVIFGIPTQTATVLALAGAGLTVALKDFIVGFFGWFVLMGKNGIRHGDWVEINGVSGEVVEIGLFHTVLFETGNWNDSGHPTGRRVTFVNSYAIEGHYFNFSTSGQWLWDELQIALPADQDPYPIVDEVQKIVTKETEANARLAEQEWAGLINLRETPSFTAGPAISVRPSNLGFEILVRYVTRANERHKQRSNLYHEIIELLRRRNIPQPAQHSASSSVAVENA
jgi:small-conductance mechanosensitive channel